MRVLVTGAEGFTGRYVTAALRLRGHECVGLRADLTDAAATTSEVGACEADAVVHLAARAFVHSDDFETFYKTNQVGTFNLLQAVAIHRPGARVVLASSANIYGATESASLNEDDVPNPVNHYALSKWAMEKGAKFWANQLEITIVRPFNYTGVGQSEQFLIPKIIGHVRRGAPEIALGNLDSARDIGDVRVVADVYCELVERPVQGGVVNICTGQGVTPRKILEIASQLAGHSPKVVVDQRFVRRNEIPYLVGDNRRLRALLPDWHPISLEETIAWMLESAPLARA